MGPLSLLGSGAASALLFMLRDGVVDLAFLGGSLLLLLLIGVSKGLWFAKSAEIPTGRAIVGSLIAGVLSLFVTVAIAFGMRDQRMAVFAVPVLLIAIAVGSMRYGRVLPSSPWDLLTPARVGLLQLVGAAMAAVWVAFAAGIEPSISPRNFELFRGVIQFIALLVCCVIAGIWDGAMACTLAPEPRMRVGTAVAMRANLAILGLGTLAIIWGASR